MKLAPNTSSPHFVEAYVAECAAAGLPPEMVAEHYHTLRLKEACLTSDAFKEGFEKEAVGGLFSKALELGWRASLGAARTLGRRSLPDAMSRSFKGFHVLPKTTLMGNAFRSPLANDLGSIRSRLWAWSRRTNAGRSLMGRTLGEGALLYGGASAIAGVNPLSTARDAISGAVRGSPMSRLNMPDFVSIDSRGRLTPNVESGAWASALHMQDQMHAMDRRIQSLQHQASQTNSGDIRTRVAAMDAQRELSKLTRERNRVASQFSRIAGGAQSTNMDFSRQLERATGNVDARIGSNQARGASAVDRLDRLNQSGIGRMVAGIPLIGANANARRLVGQDNRLRAERGQLGRMSEDWQNIDQVLQTGKAPSKANQVAQRFF